jgi:hypothetical protein
MGTDRNLRTRITSIAALVILFTLVPIALADKGGTPNGGGGGGAGGGGGGGKGAATDGGGSTSTSGSSTLSLSSETVQLNRNLPSWCLSEDDLDQRVFSGSLFASYSTSYRLCDLNADGFTAGGIGLESDATVIGQLSDLTIAAPDGSVHHAVLMSQTSSKGVTSSRYAVCYVPPYYLSTDIGTDPLMGGTWQIALSGQISSAYWTTRAQMTNTTFQQNYCPAGQQNLLP